MPSTIPDTTVEVTFTSSPFDSFTLDDPVRGVLDNTDFILGGDVFTDITEDVLAVAVTRGKSRTLDHFTAGRASIQLQNRDREYDPLYTAGPLFGQITIYSKLALIPRLRELGVQIYLSSRVECSKAGVKIINNLNNFELALNNCTAIIDCGPRLANDQLYQAAEPNQPSRVQVIGDALSPRTAAEAVYEGNALGVFLDLDLALAALDNH
jgi:hypothetical protein